MNSPEQPSAVVIEPNRPAEASIIWLHGLGADGHDFEPLVPELGLTDLAVRFIFPHAPQRPVTINAGYVMRAWYDIRSDQLNRREDEEGIRRSEAQLRAWIEAEQAKGVASDRIILAGFSQGGAIALHTGIRYEQPLAGVLALSTYLPLEEQAEAERRQRTALPIFMAHGRDDPLIPISTAVRSCQKLQALGFAPEWHEYAMPHSLCGEEVRDIANWLRTVLTAPA